MLTALAGYLTPPLLGAGAAWLLAAHHVTATLWLLLAVLMATFLAIRNAFGVLAVALSAAAVVAVTWYASATAQAVFGYGVTWFLLLGGLRPVVELQRQRWRGRRRVAVAALALGGRLLIAGALYVPHSLYLPHSLHLPDR